MHTKHVVFAALITLFCAGAVIAAITGLSEPISAENTPQRFTITPVESTSTAPVPVIVEPQGMPTTTADLTTISTTSTSTTNDTQASTSLAQ